MTDDWRLYADQGENSVAWDAESWRPHATAGERAQSLNTDQANPAIWRLLHVFATVAPLPPAAEPVRRVPVGPSKAFATALGVGVKRALSGRHHRRSSHPGAFTAEPVSIVAGATTIGSARRPSGARYELSTGVVAEFVCTPMSPS